jgi:hypothetical protein
VPIVERYLAISEQKRHLSFKIIVLESVAMCEQKSSMRRTNTHLKARHRKRMPIVLSKIKLQSTRTGITGGSNMQTIGMRFDFLL